MTTAHTVRSPRFDQLDALRGLGCLSVMWIHGGWLAAYTSNVFVGGSPAGRALISDTHMDWWLRHAGHVAVEMFFVMSAFLLWRPFSLAAQAGVGRESVGGYLVRRVARVVPGFWAALFLVALWQQRADVLSFPGGLRFFFFGQNLTDATTFGGIAAAWTLAVEAQFYLLLGALALARRRAGAGIRFELVAAGSLVLLAAVWRLIAVQPASDAPPPGLALISSLPAHADSFALGILLAGLSVRCTLDARLAWGRFVRARPGWMLVAAVIVFLAGVQLLGLESPFALSRSQGLLRAWLDVVVAGLLIVPFAFAPDARGLVHRLLARPMIVKLGRWSFGAYLWHQAIFAALAHDGMRAATKSGFVLFVAAGMTLSFVLGALSWVVLERPAVRWAARRTARNQPAPAHTNAQKMHPALEAA